MLSSGSGADAGISGVPQGVHHGLYVDLIKASSLASVTPLRADSSEPSWSSPRRYSLHDQCPERDKDSRKKKSSRQPMEYNLEETTMASLASLYDRGPTQKYQASQGNIVKGIRAVNIMDTLSQLAGTEALTPPRRPMLHKALPATPITPLGSSTPRTKTRGRTPDWIKRIFDYAKRGQLDQLRLSLRDMEATLVRNLSDHHGNNLLHVLACQGHESALAWLCSYLQGAHLQLEGALADENRSGLTPAACAVKYGHSNCVEWLVTNTRLREKLSSKDGERCLLHIAAKYNQDSVLHWLVNAMKVRQINLDQRDHCGDTPLHLASRTGQLETCRILLSNGSNVSAKNDLGLKASDMALASGHAAIQHYLNLFEASLCVAGELSLVQNNFESLRAENVELKGYFRDVLSIGKRLAKERDEMCRDALGRLQKSAGLAVQDKVMSVLVNMEEENKMLRERLGMPPAASSSVESVQSMLNPSANKLCDLVGGNWKGLVVSGLADMEHRLLMAEEGWRKLSYHSNTDRVTFTLEKMPIDILRHQVDQIEEQQKSLATKSLTLGNETHSLSSSESSLDTLLSLQTGTTDNIYSQLIDCKTPPIVSAPQPPPPPSKRRESREELKRRLQDMALTSESGNASVLEVIEPTTSESEEERTEKSKLPSIMPFLVSSSPRLKSLSVSLEDELEKIQEPARAVLQRRCSSVQDLLDSDDTSVRLQDNQPDLLIGTATMGETGDDEIISDHHTLSSSTPTPPQMIKKRTFLQKITMKAGWSSSKRKATPKSIHKRINEITPDDFKETYMARNLVAAESPCSTSSTSQQESGEEVASAPSHRSRSSGSSSSSETCGQRSEKNKLKIQSAQLIVEPEPDNSPERKSLEVSVDLVQEPDQSVQEEPPPPIPPSSPPTTHRLVKTALAEIKSGHLPHHHIESMSVTTSEDSGIVARPSSSASKSDSLLSSRPDSSSSSLFKGFSLRLTSTELVSVGGRISPAPSDLSKADSTRLLGKIEEMRLCEDESTTKLAVRLKSEKKLGVSACSPKEVEKLHAKDSKNGTEKSTPALLAKKRSERAWYDLSDEEPDLLSSATRLSAVRTSSDEEVNA